MSDFYLKNRFKYFLLIVLCSVFAFLNAEMEEACDLYYKGDPSELKDSSIHVPEEVVAVSSKILVDMPTDTATIVGGTPSILFVIDHSGSMCYWHSGGEVPRDSLGRRFSVTRDLIDTLKNMFPKTEVAVAVFGTHLYFDPTDSAWFVQCPGYDVNGYIPFFRFDSSYADHGGKPGWMVVKEMLETDTIDYPTAQDPTYRYVGLKYKPTNDHGFSTNINVGFDVAKHAFQNASYPKNRQFIIFLSDGAATVANGPHDPFSGVEDFVQGDSVPTTFTIFFTPSGNPPQTLTQMTSNIQDNGYSSMNPNSLIEAISSDTLMSYIMNNIMGIIVQEIVGSPVDITVNGTQVSNYDSVNNQFTFDNHFPLTGVTSNFEYMINYIIAKDSIVELPNGGYDTIVVQSDSSDSGDFEVVVDPDVTGPPDWYPHQFELICWERELLYYFNGSEISVVNETMDPVDLRFNFDPGDKNYNYTNVTIEVKNKAGIAKDSETFDLSGSGNSFTGSFPRVVIDDASSPTPGNGTLEHYLVDTLVATFRNNENPKLPLDTLEEEIPFIISGQIDIIAGYYFDNNADGFVDSIYVEASTDIGGGLSDEHVEELLENAITLPDFRNFTINGSGALDDGFYIDVTEDNENPTTYVKDEDKLQVSQYIVSIGGWVPTKTAPIYDRVAPIIHWADKSAFLIDFQVDSVADSLTVKFSEPITDVTHEAPFLFLSMEEDKEYQAQLSHVSHNNDIMKFTVTGFNNVSYMRHGDSIWIQRTDRVGDNANPVNYQNNNNNTKRMLWVERRLIPYELIPNSTSPIDISNPNDENSIIPNEVVDIINNIDPNWLNNNGIQNDNGDFIGMIITISPNEDPDILLPDFKLEGYISIFDAVGNQIVSREEMLWWEEQNTLIWIWSGKNMNDRNVGAGSYLAISEIEEKTESLGYQENGPKDTKKIYVGIME